MSSQISQIFEVIEDIKDLIKDTQYKTNFENLIQSYNNNNNNYLPNETPTTERDIEIKRLTDEILTNVKLRVAEIKQQNNI
jgi:hypothetical protein